MSNTAMKCPTCGRPNRAGARFCIHCGVDVTAVRPAAQVAMAGGPSAAPSTGVTADCPQCGQDITPGARFCRHCGQTLSSTAKAVTAEPANPSLPSPAVALPIHSTPGPISKTMPLTRASSVQPPAAGQAKPDGTPLFNLAATASPPARPAARRFSWPAWLWALAGFIVGLLTVSGLLWAQPTLFPWMHLAPSATMTAPASVVPTPVAQPSPTLAANRPITAPPPALTTPPPVTTSAGLQPTATITQTAGATTTVKPVTR